jgi:hypothetical protein
MNEIYWRLGVAPAADDATDLFPLAGLARYGAPASLALPTAIYQIITVRNPYDQARARKALRRALWLSISGGNQIRKSIEGIIAASDGGKFDKRGHLQFFIREPIEKSRAILFGPYGTKAGREYIENRGQKKQKVFLRLLR